MKITCLLLAALVPLLSSCASSLTQSDLEGIKVVGVINSFPDKPKYTQIGTTVFNNEYDEVADTSFKSYITTEVMELLKAKGYRPVALPNKDTLTPTDLIIEIYPRDMYNMPYTMGYGFYQRSLLGINAYKISYAALNLIPSINGTKKCAGCYGESTTPFPFKSMPTKWSEIDSKRQIQLCDQLKTDIASAIRTAFSKTGL